MSKAMLTKMQIVHGRAIHYAGLFAICLPFMTIIGKPMQIDFTKACKF